MAIFLGRISELRSSSVGSMNRLRPLHTIGGGDVRKRRLATGSFDRFRIGVSLTASSAEFIVVGSACLMDDVGCSLLVALILAMPTPFIRKNQRNNCFFNCFF